MNNLLNNLKYLRNTKDRTQTRIAFCIGVEQKLYSAWETGRSEPSTEMLHRLSLYYSVSIDYLVRKDLSVIDPAKLQNNFLLIQEQLAEIDSINTKAVEKLEYSLK